MKLKYSFDFSQEIPEQFPVAVYAVSVRKLLLRLVAFAMVLALAVIAVIKLALLDWLPVVAVGAAVFIFMDRNASSLRLFFGGTLVRVYKKGVYLKGLGFVPWEHVESVGGSKADFNFMIRVDGIADSRITKWQGAGYVIETVGKGLIRYKGLLPERWAAQDAKDVFKKMLELKEGQNRETRRERLGSARFSVANEN